MKAGRKSRTRAGKTTRKAGRKSTRQTPAKTGRKASGKAARKSTRKTGRKTSAMGSNDPLWIQADSGAETPDGHYGSRRIAKRIRRSPAQIAAIKAEIQAFRSEMKDIGLVTASVRQIFYQMESRGFVPKDEKGYKLIGRYLTEMREDGKLPFTWISDATRWRRELRTYPNPRDFITNSMRGYRRDPWQDIDARVEVWVEKEAMASVFGQVTEEWNVPLMVTKGYPSLSFVQQAGLELDFSDDDSPAYIYYFGDHDPSGRDIARVVEEKLRKYAPETEIHFEHVAVLPWQITEWNLPTRPTKRGDGTTRGDSRAPGFKGDSVELDSIPPKRLFAMIEECITQHMWDGCWEQHLEQQAKDIEILKEAASLARMATGDFGDLDEDDDDDDQTDAASDPES